MNRKEQIVNEIQSMMDRTMKEFIGENCNPITIEHIRCSMLDRFNREFVLTGKVESGIISVEFRDEYPTGVVAAFDVELPYPFGHRDRVVCCAYC